jgi:hypothetical protein
MRVNTENVRSAVAVRGNWQSCCFSAPALIVRRQKNALHDTTGLAGDSVGIMSSAQITLDVRQLQTLNNYEVTRV